MYKLELKRVTGLLVILMAGLMMAACNDESPPTAAATEPDVADVSVEASLTVSAENGGGPYADEGSKKVIDKNKDSKFFLGNYSSDFWMQQTFDNAVAINAYTITSGNDAPDRDPKSWDLLGSNDGGNWELIDNQTDVTFDLRNGVKIYRLDSDVSYEFYRIAITENNGSGAFQLSEWRLLHYNN